MRIPPIPHFSGVFDVDKVGRRILENQFGGVTDKQSAYHAEELDSHTWAVTINDVLDDRAKVALEQSGCYYQYLNDLG